MTQLTKPERRIRARREFDDTEPRPWLRLWARGLDLFYHSFVIGLIWQSVDPEGLQQINSVVTTIGFMMLWVVLESLYMLAFGTTPGKLLLRIRVRQEHGERLSGDQVWRRSALVWLFGMGAGIGILTIVANIVAYRRLKSEGATSWDRNLELNVSYGRLGLLRSFVALALGALMAIMIGFGLMV
ncbi:RDD family protein [Paenibacillus athensensis]|nr:RDD family protein [Paenibacillus athensensis]MCD1258657.1 RDD family protein [Paenibacillus athensensis]